MKTTKTKKLTIKQAWLRIAREFEGKKTECSKLGLCFAASCFCSSGLITVRQLYLMGARIRKHQNELGQNAGSYLFPISRRKSRAKLARKFAAERKK